MLLSVTGLEVRYGAVEAVRGIDLGVDRGEIVTLLGANGAGKSSTLNAIVGQAPRHAGRVILDGRDVSGMATEHLVRQGVTLTPEGRLLFGTLTVEENLLMGGYSIGVRSDRFKERLAWLHELFPILADRRHQLAGTLSGGQQQQLAIARSMMSCPSILLLDEPSLGLAPLVVETIFDLISQIRKAGTTILLVEQNVAMALEIADRGYVLDSGRIIHQGTARELAGSDAVERAYLGRED